MTATEQRSSPIGGPKGRGVLCIKCDHLNRGERDVCRRCGGELYVKCPKCGTKTPQVYTRCQVCRTKVPSKAATPRRKRRRRAKLVRALLMVGTLVGIAGAVYYGVRLFS